ncbi:DUF4432 family protein [Acidimicrobiaceae bacterium USS-CC1]|uniref:DUF4432 family protein n=1 Tax=Acidiferrimicrobium australe TaxID=2664430 RepID=A0ABW9QTS7_9ACTN|nr:DUF4432 family protein [Acidiferrimicrobium australe]
MTCTVSEEERAGWRALVLDNGELRVAVLPEKGGDVYELVDVASGVDVLFKAPSGLRPPGSAPLRGSGDTPFLAHYEGGWQELFPSVGSSCSYRGRAVPFHGEVAVRAWDASVLSGRGSEATVELVVRCETVPLVLRRTLRLSDGSRRLVVDEEVSNRSDQATELVWGHHLVLGAPFVEDGCRLDTPASVIVTPADLWEATARLAPGQRSRWPIALGAAGAAVDLRAIPGHGAASHDDVYLTGLSAGWASVDNRRLGLRVTLGFDPELFRWLVSWQPYGGARAEPLAGSYGVGLEPWTTNLNLEDAVRAGDAVVVAGGAVLRTRLTVDLHQIGG